MKKTVDPDCIFCKIVAGGIPCSKVYEDDEILAFLDINPVARGHTLVLPKAHYPTLLDVPSGVGEAWLRALRLVGKAVLDETSAGGFNCIQNNFAPAGQVVFHSHWHVIPRFENDGLVDWPGKSADSEELKRLAQSVKARINVF